MPYCYEYAHSVTKCFTGSAGLNITDINIIHSLNMVSENHRFRIAHNTNTGSGDNNEKQPKITQNDLTHLNGSS